jgi:hypothetical protein
MNIQKLLLSTIASVAMTMGAVSTAGAASIDGTATAEVFQAVGLTQFRGMDFGIFAAPGLAEAAGTVVLSAADPTARTFTNDVLPVTSTPLSAIFNITGKPNETVAIVIADTVNELTGPGADMNFSPDAGNLGASTTLSATGTAQLIVGGTLSVAAGQLPGTYSSINAYTVTVTYQ